MRYILFSVIISFSSFFHFANAQNAVVKGVVTDSTGNYLQDVNVVLAGTKRGTSTNRQGEYVLMIPADQPVTLIFSYLQNLKPYSMEPLNPGEERELNVIFSSQLSLRQYEIKEESGRSKIMMKKIDPKIISHIPTASGNLESILKTLPGVSSNNELSSTYSVRGGNYDENIVYINDVEIYRPFLVRAGQQEGMSIINSALVESIEFSAGGFPARYGDKLSSVLDIEYKRPLKFGASAEASLLGANAHVEGASKDYRFTYLLGGRYRSNQYLLNSLETQGDYQPTFGDVQGFFTYHITPEFEINWLTYYGSNQFRLIPESRETTWGTAEVVLRLNIFFDGQEIMAYKSLLNAVTAKYQPDPKTELTLTGSAYQTSEQEYFDIVGQYFLDQLETDPGSENFGGVKYSLGSGAYLDHGRNNLYANIYNIEHRGHRNTGNFWDLRWGLKYQHEIIEDELREYRYLDSADYSVPVATGDELTVESFVKSRINLSSNRYSGFLENTWELSKDYNSFLTGGVRANYWDYNEELIISPRLQMVIEPNRRHNTAIIRQGQPDSLLKNNVQLRAATGLYFQPPFYRELRSKEGTLNPEVLSQKSYHAVVGAELIFKLWERSFKWTSEIYYKYLWDLIPYDIEDVRIRYTAKNEAVGYAAGLDMQVYGEFIEGLPSWFSFSLMKTQEKMADDFFVEEDTTYANPGYLPRPTDQRFTFAILFQDNLPMNEDIKAHLNLVYGHRLPYGPPALPQFRNLLRMPPYRRVDVGFSYQAYSAEKRKKETGALKHFESIWFSAEIFNAFGIRNTISYIWVKDIQNNLWSVPNNLTSRRLNLRMIVKI
ncbi:MAG: carboxypeptidase-like regulatory domain-containing protein [Bacteroidia bacterium]